MTSTSHHIALSGVNNNRQSVWWKEVELWVHSKGREPHMLPHRPSSHPQPVENCVLVPPVMQSLAKKRGNNRSSGEQKELGKPAARLVFFPQHRTCKHSNVFFQKSVGTRLGYFVIIPVFTPL